MLQTADFPHTAIRAALAAASCSSIQSSVANEFDIAAWVPLVITPSLGCISLFVRPRVKQRPKLSLVIKRLSVGSSGELLHALESRWKVFGIGGPRESFSCLGLQATELGGEILCQSRNGITKNNHSGIRRDFRLICFSLLATCL